jgi:hypothetical protein
MPLIPIAHLKNTRNLVHSGASANDSSYGVVAGVYKKTRPEWADSTDEVNYLILALTLTEDQW